MNKDRPAVTLLKLTSRKERLEMGNNYSWMTKTYKQLKSLFIGFYIESNFPQDICAILIVQYSHN